MKTRGSTSQKTKRQPSKVKSIDQTSSHDKTGGSSSRPDAQIGSNGVSMNAFGQITEEQRQAGLEKARQSRENRKSWLRSCTKTYEVLEARHPNHANKIKQLESGSLKAAIKLKCLGCTLGHMEEIKNCSVVSCPLWPVRHWKNTEGVTDDQS
jgi:hypothetical protein